MKRRIRSTDGNGVDARVRPLLQSAREGQTSTRPFVLLSDRSTARSVSKVESRNCCINSKMHWARMLPAWFWIHDRKPHEPAHDPSAANIDLNVKTSIWVL